MKFMDEYLKGEWSRVEAKLKLSSYIDDWKNSSQNRQVWDYLGMTQEQYKTWLVENELPPCTHPFSAESAGSDEACKE